MVLITRKGDGYNILGVAKFQDGPLLVCGLGRHFAIESTFDSEYVYDGD